MLNEDRKGPTSNDLADWGATESLSKSRGIGGIVDSVCQYLEDRKLIDKPS